LFGALDIYYCNYINIRIGLPAYSFITIYSHNIYSERLLNLTVSGRINLSQVMRTQMLKNKVIVITAPQKLLVGKGPKIYLEVKFHEFTNLLRRITAVRKIYYTTHMSRIIGTGNRQAQTYSATQNPTKGIQNLSHSVSFHSSPRYGRLSVKI
jgi:xanthine dehydrogenase molybdopterin-binding subunit B